MNVIYYAFTRMARRKGETLSGQGVGGRVLGVVFQIIECNCVKEFNIFLIPHTLHPTPKSQEYQGFTLFLVPFPFTL
ncbi:hypothetical protein ACWATR_32835 [Nostoc sp. UIC 10890]